MNLVSPELLSEQQRVVLDEYSRLFPSGAVCVNVALGKDAWDLRPLLLSLGKVSIVRFSKVLGSGHARMIAGELEGFSVLCNREQRVQLLPEDGRFMLLRPYYSATLQEELGANGSGVGIDRRGLASDLIKVVAALGKRGVAHGHISPSNIVRQGGQILLVDPVVGALHQTIDNYLAPEIKSGQQASHEADLFGLGRTLGAVLEELLTSRQAMVVQELLLPSPRQRPSIEEVASIFNVEIDNPAGRKASYSARDSVGRGRLLRAPKSPGESSEYPDVHAQVQDAHPGAEKAARSLQSNTVGNMLLIALITSGLLVWFIKERYPSIYFELVSRLPMLAAQHSAEYEADWASRETSRMALVGRAGVIRREPAAINTVINDLTTGANPESVNGALMRVALADSWREQITPTDKHAALVFSLEKLVPEGRSQLGELQDLHPGVILAVLGQTPFKKVPAELLQMPIDSLVALPNPFGELFSQVKAMGAKTLGDPAVIGLAAIVTGNARAPAFELFLGDGMGAAQTLAKVALIEPIVLGDSAGIAELFGVLGDRGGDITALVRWFDVIDIAGWNTVSPPQKLQLILGDIPKSDFTLAQLSDLLTFPLESIRQQAVPRLKSALQEDGADRLLAMLVTPAHGFTREQVIALLATLSMPEEARLSYVPAWFNLKPSPDGVLLTLLSRSHKDASDIFNLDAARYLRRQSWSASTDILKLLASHGEPLARILAYGKLDPNKEAERSILLESKLREKDPSCTKVLEARLSLFKGD